MDRAVSDNAECEQDDEGDSTTKNVRVAVINTMDKNNASY